MNTQTKPLLSIKGLKKYFPIRKGLLARQVGQIYAVDGVSFSVGRGETLALVGESGCGKSTIGRMILRLIKPTAGEIMIEGVNLVDLSRRRMKPFRRRVQIVFQDPYASLTPYMSAGQIVSEPLQNYAVGTRAEQRQKVGDIFERVGLRRTDIKKFPHEFSGGQRQRIGIARALALNPDLIICDEPVSALDVSVRAQVINILTRLQDQLQISYLFISHDLSVVEHISHRVAVMYLGQIVEIAPTRDIFQNPVHPYTQALLSAVPVPDPMRSRKDRIRLEGDVPNPSDPPSGCRFRTRCPLTRPSCSLIQQNLKESTSGHWAACSVRLP
ncbi:MAG: ABC transporter ATP-binding protein [Desulfarculaceae bacterium]|jgi:peptide/nickel transport system ATP-binding protein/oligopeptide transport system ATP-binding protein